jgi:hypothetical protein
VPVTSVAAASHFPSGHVESSEQGGGSVLDVIMRPALHLGGLHRQQRLSAVQRLDLRLLIHAQNNRLLRRMQVETHHIGERGRQLRVGAELEAAAALGLNLVVAPDRGTVLGLTPSSAATPGPVQWVSPLGGRPRVTLMILATVRSS